MIRHPRYSPRGGDMRLPRFQVFFTFIPFALSLLVLAAVTSSASAAFLQNYGTHAAPDLTYFNVTESNGGTGALFAAPSYSGNSIKFSPPNFLAQVLSGPGSVIVDSTINTTLQADPGKFLNNIKIDEAGDHTLSGLNGGEAELSAGAAFFVTVLEVNGADATGLGLPTLTQNMLVTTGAGPNGGEYARPGDDGSAVIWDGSVFIDLDAFLDDFNVEGNVTKAHLAWDNTLTAAADAVSSGFIKKKVVNGIVLTTNVPEPTTWLLAVAGALACGLVRRRG